MKAQPWIANPRIETVFILLPPFLSLAFIALFPALFQNNQNFPDAWWVILILLVDVAHVYSTLYRTYFDPYSFQKYRQPLTWIPLISLILGVALYWQSPHWFWRILAYLAVFHFVRQQYGFLRIYSRNEPSPAWMKKVDTFTIYYATLYPLIDWHLGKPRNFNWFVDNDFVFFRADSLLKAATILYWLTIIVYVARELIQAIRTRYLNIPRVAILAGTILSWYFGIVYYNGDMAFTFLNVVSHGIPYMALIWLYGQRQQRQQSQPPDQQPAVRPTSSFLKTIFSTYGIVLFLGIIFLLAYVEEGLWDMTVWKEHVNVFAVFHVFNQRPNSAWLTLIVPVLALPQITHYVIDGYIWRRPAKKGVFTGS